ncbi:MAG: tRNA (guanosine(37)-N1)-methyltransferase TrmD [Gammaproteobacteria bacterium]|nr:tRNA (guanosine(37)-N1)-methyltransferase TrmD [Gammaproteobacteria bacterium]
MRIDVVTLFPQMIAALMEWGIVGRAARAGLLDLRMWNPRDYARDVHRTVDDRPYGGGPGMVMMVEPLRDAIRAARAAAPGPSHVIYLSPQGRRFDQARALELAGGGPRPVLVAGRYEGVDERVLESEIDEELSIGDYVLSGGELAAAVVIDAATRLLPGAVGDEESVQQDSFTTGMLEYPHYTRPREIDGRTVPEVLLRGNHREIEEWRFKQAVLRTRRRRPELLAGLELDKVRRKWLAELPPEDARDLESDSTNSGKTGTAGESS